MDKQKDLVPGAYAPRIVDQQVERYLHLFGAVEISGTKWCGKTWTALNHGKSVTYVDREPNLQITKGDPTYALIGDAPHVIDEWQRVPAIWDDVRHAVDDAGGKKGLWILTGSSTPLPAGAKSHSGAGRIGRVRMHPRTLQEEGKSTGAVSLRRLFEHDFTPSQCPNGIIELAKCIVSGGWPGETSGETTGAQEVIQEYLNLIFSESIPSLDRNPETARRVALSIARNLGQSVTHATLAKDVFALSREEATETQLRKVADYANILRQLYLVDEVPGWVPASRSSARMRVKPKLYFADPSLAVGLLGLNERSLMEDWQTFGLAFENLVMRDLDVYARTLPNVVGNPLRYYRDDSGLECDAIIERSDGSWAGIEIKLSQEKVDQAAKHLLRIQAKVTRNKNAHTPDPVFLAVITGMGEAAYQRPDGVYVIPIRSLGA